MPALSGTRIGIASIVLIRMSSSLLPSVEADEPPPVLVDDAVNRLVGEPGHAGPFDDVVDLMEAGDDMLRGRRGEVGAEEELVLDAVLQRRDERLVVPQGPVVERRDVGEEVR